jgi:hypothetical protein
MHFYLVEIVTDVSRGLIMLGLLRMSGKVLCPGISRKVIESLAVCMDVSCTKPVSWFGLC